MIRYIGWIALFTFISCSTGSEIDTPEAQAFVDCIEEEIPTIDSVRYTTLVYQLDTFFKEKPKYRHINGCIIVHDQGVPVYQYYHGLHQLRHQSNDSIHEGSVFQLASLSKTFTALAILILVEKNKLRLEDSVQQFYPDFPYSGITIRSLLSHRSGLPNYMFVYEDSIRSKHAPPDNQTLMQWLIATHPDRYAYPNRKFSYNNTNYAILAAIIEQLSGQSYADFIREQIALPLGMYSTFAGEAWKSSTTLPLTQGHEGKRAIPVDYWDYIVGDKGIYSTANDLIQWYKALQSPCLVSDSTLKKAFTPQSFESKGFRNYGLGFRMWLDDEQQHARYIYHNGWWKGYTTLFWFHPEKKCGVIILSNVKNKAIYHIKDIIAVLEGMPSSSVEMEQED